MRSLVFVITVIFNGCIGFPSKFTELEFQLGPSIPVEGDDNYFSIYESFDAEEITTTIESVALEKDSESVSLI